LHFLESSPDVHREDRGGLNLNIMKKQTYREAIDEIEEILGNIENDELEVDDLVEKVRKVTELLKFCKDKLYKTQEEVEKALKEMEG
jgi:exodeoxyribonuclease VII small subunit